MTRMPKAADRRTLSNPALHSAACTILFQGPLPILGVQPSRAGAGAAGTGGTGWGPPHPPSCSSHRRLQSAMWRGDTPYRCANSAIVRAQPPRLLWFGVPGCACAVVRSFPSHPHPHLPSLPQAWPAMAPPSVACCEPPVQVLMLQQVPCAPPGQPRSGWTQGSAPQPRGQCRYPALGRHPAQF